jgi:hypothetical protein
MSECQRVLARELLQDDRQDSLPQSTIDPDALEHDGDAPDNLDLKESEQIYKYTNIQMHNCTNAQIHKYTNTQIHKYTRTQGRKDKRTKEQKDKRTKGHRGYLGAAQLFSHSNLESYNRTVSSYYFSSSEIASDVRKAGSNRSRHNYVFRLLRNISADAE